MPRPKGPNSRITPPRSLERAAAAGREALRQLKTMSPGKQGEIAVKVIDDRGNELLVVRRLKEGK